jgi:hypothetical protein
MSGHFRSASEVSMILGSRQFCQLTGLALVLLGVTASTAGAQGRPWEDRGFVNINFAQQTTERTTIVTGTVPIYGEDATFESAVRVGRASMFDIMGGWKVWRNLAVGIGYARYSDPSTAVVTGAIPDPLFFDTPHAFSTLIAGQEHTENAVHLSATWMVPLGDNLDVAIFAGPSFISLRKDLASGITVEGGTSNLESVTTSRVSGTGVGGHVGLDIRYTVLEDMAGISKIGFGLFFRYSGASVDANVQGGKVDVGGASYGLGIRIGF